jgi:hypothetical protein
MRHSMLTIDLTFIAEETRKDWSNLIAIIALLEDLVEKLDAANREYILHFLLRLTADANLMNDARVSRATEDGIALFITYLPDDRAEEIVS